MHPSTHSHTAQEISRTRETLVAGASSPSRASPAPPAGGDPPLARRRSALRVMALAPLGALAAVVSIFALSPALLVAAFLFLPAVLPVLAWLMLLAVAPVPPRDLPAARPSGFRQGDQTT